MIWDHESPHAANVLAVTHVIINAFSCVDPWNEIGHPAHSH